MSLINILCMCRSRAKNMVLMGYLGGKELLSNSQKSLSQRLTLEVHTYDIIVCLSVPVCSSVYMCIILSLPCSVTANG